jgi:UDP-4-amino-4,6-dideoxy-N-acetyl-beta-L-altrosamine N-acetyltransferase
MDWVLIAWSVGLSKLTSSLREMTENDLETVLSWRNHLDVRRFMFDDREIPMGEHRNWFERTRSRNTTSLLLLEIDGAPKAFMNISRLEDDCPIAEWGFYAAPGAAKGTGRLLGRLSLDFAFRQLNLHKVFGRVLSFNDTSLRFHTSMGFSREGVLRDQFFDGENFFDVVYFGMLSHDWLMASQDP